MTDTLTPEAVEAALGTVRSVLQADGADVELVAVEGDAAHLRLVLVDANCAECVLPRGLLQDVALQMLRADLPALAAVEIDDPREAS